MPTENGVINMTVMRSLNIAPADDLNNYVRNFIQWYYVILNFQDTIKEGDIYRTNVILKIMIPFFFIVIVLYQSTLLSALTIFLKVKLCSL